MRTILRRLVRDRAERSCEYCKLPDYAAPTSTFHVEHVIAKQHGGSDGIENLAWCCHRCNLHKGQNLSGIDPISDRVVRLFDPRHQSWKRHFEWRDAIVFGRTQTGRATLTVLNINDPRRVELRRILMDESEWPDGS